MVSIVILSYNTEDLLRRCLTSLFEHIPEKEAEVIVVDNASKDDSVKTLKKQFPQVKLIENDTNSGFAGGCNLGAKHARGEYLLFLNSDTQISDNPLPELLKTMSTGRDCGVVGGLLKNHDDSLQRSFGDFYSVKNIAFFLFGGEKYEAKHFVTRRVKEVDWVSGGFMLVKSDIYQELKGFDENFFMYIEDMELCYRVKKIGITYFC
jgi:GT2 family glycosyltransferase